jgi:predicted metal-binding membrane protein
LNTEAALAALLSKDRAIALVALITLTTIAWAPVLLLAQSMAHMAAMRGMTDMPAMTDMPGMHGDPLGMMSRVFGQWSAGHFLAMLSMWTVMMIGMMTPSVAPMILIYTQIARCNAVLRPFASAFWFAGGYLLCWTGFSLLATLTQWGLEQLALLRPMMASASHVFGGLLLILAGIYQWLPIKQACLSQCRAPLTFVMSHGGFRADPAGSVRLGLQHGLYCIGCCWTLMALLFVGGIMNLWWIAALMIFVLLEKLLPASRNFARISGLGAATLGIGYLF